VAGPKPILESRASPYVLLACPGCVCFNTHGRTMSNSGICSLIPRALASVDRRELHEPNARHKNNTYCNCDKTTSEGVRHQEQFERFSVKREHNQHIIVHYHIIHLSKSYYNLGSCIRYIKRFEAKTTLQRLIRVCGSDFFLGQDIPFLP
jgi:hypothetical protein